MGVYLVTGVAGFIASKVAEFLLGDGHTVVGVDNLNDAYDVRLKHWRLERIKSHAAFRFYRLDISEWDALCDLFDSFSAVAGRTFDAVINLAARAGVRKSVEDPWVYIDTNVTGTLNLLELCRKSGVSKFVLASTSSLYGADSPMPYREDAPANTPLSPYAASKKAAEMLCHTYHYLHGLDVTIFRYFTVYGPAGRPDMSLFRFVQWISEERPVMVYGDGRQSRDFTYVDDIARGTIAGLKPIGYDIINLGSDQPVVLLDAIREIESQVGKQAKLEFKPRHSADMPATWADIGKAQKLIEWKPRTSFSEGVRRVVGWYKDNQDWAKQVETL
ncbi:MAG: nucleotide sugar epimerase [Chloroflexi bacterium RBG_13_56_8]|nr:MAG: nucleotide sugar epimerase [Chloroflexi bacterium RBG_13_56_8]